MKTAPVLLTVCFLAVLVGCKNTESVKPTPVSDPSFNQVDIAFAASHVGCLLDQWYKGTYRNEPIVFRLINDVNTYNAFFSCSSTIPLPAIDFTTKSLLMGMKADYGQFINSPVNISGIEQKLVQTNNGTYTLQVKVTGTPGTGGEWFAFTSVVPKVTGTINLDMQYQFK